MAGLGSAPPPQGGAGANGSTGLDNLTRKVDEMRINAATQAHQNNNYNNTNNSGHHNNHNNYNSHHNNNYNQNYRGRGRGGNYNGPRAAKVEVPDAEFDFASSNAKFNKDDVVKEAIASGTLEADVNAAATAGVASGHGSEAGGAAGSEGGDAPVAYSKKSSFFDNISSEAKDRAAAAASNSGNRPGGREWRGEEQRRNVETFGQGSVDGGYRNNNYRGRGRGRGRGGYNRGRGGNNNYRRNNDYNNNQQQQGQPQQQQQ